MIQLCLWRILQRQVRPQNLQAIMLRYHIKYEILGNPDITLLFALIELVCALHLVECSCKPLLLRASVNESTMRFIETHVLATRVVSSAKAT